MEGFFVLTCISVILSVRCLAITIWNPVQYSKIKGHPLCNQWIQMQCLISTLNCASQNASVSVFDWPPSARVETHNTNVFLDLRKCPSFWLCRNDKAHIMWPYHIIWSIIPLLIWDSGMGKIRTKNGRSRDFPRLRIWAISYGPYGAILPWNKNLGYLFCIGCHRANLLNINPYL